MAINQIKAGAILNYVIIGLNTVTGLLYTPFMLRCLGQNEYGLYSLVASIIAYLTILDFGFGNAIVRYTSKYRAEGRYTEQWRMNGMFLIVYSIIGLIAIAVGMALYYNVDALFDRTMTASDLSQAKVMMLLLTFNLAFTFPLSLFGSIITAYEDFVFQRLVNIVRILLSTFLMVVLLLIGYKAIALVVVQTIFNLFTLLINYFYARRKLRIKIEFDKIDFNFIKEISTYSFWIFLNAIMDKVYWGTGQFVLGSICGTIAVAIFSVAIMLQQMYMQFSYSFTSVLLPRFTQMVTTQSDDKAISNLFIRTGRLQASIMFLILSGFIVFGQQFINLWAGVNYSQTFYITLIFFLSLFIPSIQGTALSILQARNQMKTRTIILLITCLLSITLQIPLSKLYGALGCSLAIGVTLIIGQGICCNIYYEKYQNLDIRKFWIQIVKLLYAPLSLTILSYGILHFIDFSLSSWTHLGITIAVYLAIYILLIYKIGFNTYEQNLIIKPIRNITNKIRI